MDGRGRGRGWKDGRSSYGSYVPPGRRRDWIGVWISTAGWERTARDWSGVVLVLSIALVLAVQVAVWWMLVMGAGSSGDGVVSLVSLVFFGLAVVSSVFELWSVAMWLMSHRWFASPLLCREQSPTVTRIFSLSVTRPTGSTVSF